MHEMAAMDPGADRPRADLNEPSGFTDADDCVVMLRPDAIDAA